MTVRTDNAADFAWTREAWVTAEANAVLDAFDRALRDGADPQAACSDVAARLEGLGVR